MSYKAKENCGITIHTVLMAGFRTNLAPVSCGKVKQAPSFSSPPLRVYWVSFLSGREQQVKRRKKDGRKKERNKERKENLRIP